MSTALQNLSTRLKVDPTELQNIVLQTVMPSKQQVSEAQFTSFIAVANEYGLNPLVKEIYAFPAKGGGIQPIVSIDGWLRIINSHPDFDGMEHEDILDSGKLIAIKCSIFRKSTSRPVTVTEYMNECLRNTDTWKQWPARMLRHKATIQAGRYAFGISGIVDPDEAERMQESGVIEKDITPANEVIKSTNEQQTSIENLLTAMGKKWEELAAISKQLIGRNIQDLSELTEIEASKLINFLESKANA